MKNGRKLTDDTTVNSVLSGSPGSIPLKGAPGEDGRSNFSEQLSKTWSNMYSQIYERSITVYGDWSLTHTVTVPAEWKWNNLIEPRCVQSPWWKVYTTTSRQHQMRSAMRGRSALNGLGSERIVRIFQVKNGPLPYILRIQCNVCGLPSGFFSSTSLNACSHSSLQYYQDFRLLVNTT